MYDERTFDPDDEDLQPCTTCGNDAEYGPDPFLSEIWGDDTPIWMCRACRRSRADDI